MLALALSFFQLLLLELWGLNERRRRRWTVHFVINDVRSSSVSLRNNRTSPGAGSVNDACARAKKKKDTCFTVSSNKNSVHASRWWSVDLTIVIRMWLPIYNAYNWSVCLQSCYWRKRLEKKRRSNINAPSKCNNYRWSAVGPGSDRMASPPSPAVLCVSVSNMYF